MKIHEILNELSFFGRKCTKDCSGHRAGWTYNRKHTYPNTSASPSQSFNNGTDVAISQRAAGKNPIGPQIRGAKGRFVKFNGRK